jgi:2-hydroxy-3-keto-5-methylthiopentenyl-1-phosphate phosphatase
MTIPPAAQAEVWLDFDGTISSQDVLDEMIRKFAVDDSWKLAELQWQQGVIGSYDCLGRQIALIRAKESELLDFVDTIGLDPGIRELLQLLKQAHVPATIVSDGIDIFIERLLTNHGIDKLALRSNTVARKGKHIELKTPHRFATCETSAAHCKCNSMRVLGQTMRKTVYVGDGRSDLCPSRKADCVFAKGALAKCLDREKIAYIPWTTLGDVALHLSRAWGLKVEAA